ncbi:MAG: hypothetical protein OEV43_02290 [Coriobacteriia bacterium]|nr:hypothetical protein [Coriobacteriia bacterium]
MKQNCWEFRGCGRGPHGSKVDDLGKCPAATEQRLHGANGGKNGGRACWVVGGTLCDGTVQGSFHKKLSSCQACEFFSAVVREEQDSLIRTSELLKRLS